MRCWTGSNAKMRCRWRDSLRNMGNSSRVSKGTTTSAVMSSSIKGQNMEMRKTGKRLRLSRNLVGVMFMPFGSDNSSRVSKGTTPSIFMSSRIEGQDMQMLETGKGLKSRRDLIGATIILFDRRYRNPDRRRDSELFDAIVKRYV